MGDYHANPARHLSPDLRTEAPSALDDGRALLCDPSRSIWRHELSVKNDWTRRLRLDMLQAALRLERHGEAGGEVVTVDVVDVVDEPSGFAQTRSGGEEELTRSLRMRCREFIVGWSRPPARLEVEMPRRQDMRWTCPDCRLRHETIIDPDAEAGKIVEVNCRACGAQHEASVFFRRQGPSKARTTVGVVWL